MEQTLRSWRQAGRISLWRYRKAPRMYAGWHFSADHEGCVSLYHLLQILSGEPAPAHRTLAVTDPRAVGVDRIFGEYGLAIDVPLKLRLSNDPGGVAGAFDMSEGVFAMPLGSEDLSSFSQAVTDIRADHADFGLALGNGQILMKFWWWPKAQQA